MSNLTAFLAQNKVKKENVKFVASTSFVDENGKPIEWEIKAITSQENDDIKQQCTKRVKVAGKAGAFTMEIDPMLYVGKLAAACTVFPDLKNAELQNSYGVMGDDALLKAMLNAGEYTNYTNKVSEVNGFDETINDAIEEAKN